jgi:hypothetical protein
MKAGYLVEMTVVNWAVNLETMTAENWEQMILRDSKMAWLEV